MATYEEIKKRVKERMAANTGSSSTSGGSGSGGRSYEEIKNEVRERLIAEGWTPTPQRKSTNKVKVPRTTSAFVRDVEKNRSSGSGKVARSSNDTEETAYSERPGRERFEDLLNNTLEKLSTPREKRSTASAFAVDTERTKGEANAARLSSALTNGASALDAAEELFGTAWELAASRENRLLSNSNQLWRMNEASKDNMPSAAREAVERVQSEVGRIEDEGTPVLNLIESMLASDDYLTEAAAYNAAADRLEAMTGTQYNRTLLDSMAELERLESTAANDPDYAQTVFRGRTNADNSRVRLTTGNTDEYFQRLSGNRVIELEPYVEGFRRRYEASSRGAQAGNAIASDTEIFNLMDDRQKAVYDYYVGRGEPETAERYLDLIRPQLNYQIGEQLAAERNEWSDWDPRNLGLSTLSGLESSLGGIRNAARAVTGNDLLPQSSLATSQGLREYDSTVGQVANDLLNTTGYMVPAYAFGGTAGNVVLGVSTAGNAYQEAVNSGEDETAAVGYAILSGMTESATNALFGGIERLGAATNLTGRISGAIQSGVRKLIQNPTARAAVSTLSKYLSSAAGEGAEEFLQEYIDAGLNAVFFGTEYDGELFSDALYSALLGGLNAAVLNAPTLPSTYQQERWNEGFQQLADLMEADRKNGQTEAESEPDTMTVGEAREAAQAAQAEAAAQPETAAQDPLRAVAEEVAAEQMAQQAEAQEAEISTQAAARTMAEERAAQEAQTAQAAAQAPAQQAAAEPVAAALTQQAVQETQTQAAQAPAETVGAGEARPVETPQAAARESALQGVRDAARTGLDYEQATSGMAAQTLLTAEEREQAWTEGYRDTQAGLNYRTSRNAVRNAVEQRLRSEGNYSAENLREAYSLARTQLRLLDDLGKEYGVKITVVDSIPANGRTTGADGVFDPATGEIRVAADVSAGAYLAVGAHELTHYIKGFNDGGYRILEDTVLEALRTGGTDVDALIEAELSRFTAAERRRMSDAEAQAAAREEVVANAIPAVFTQQETVEHIARADSGLARRIADFFRNLANKLRGLLDGLTRSQRKFAAAQELAQMEEQIGEIADRFFEVLGDTSASVKRQHADQLENGTETDGVQDGFETVYSIRYDVNGRPFVVVEEDILNGVPRRNWVEAVKKVLADRFPDGVKVGNNLIKINSKTRREMTYSEYTKWLGEHDRHAYADKFRAAGYADEIILASREYINEGLKHARKDSIKDFARGTVLLRVGNFDYEADVVVGTTKSEEMLLYDIVNLQRTQINEKGRRAIQPAQSESRRSDTSATDTVPQEQTGVKNSIRENAGNDATSRAISQLGTTTSWAETGYLTPEGRQLDFSGKRDGGPRGQRSMDHREIEEIYEDEGLDGTDAMIAFMAEGNIRIIPESGGINLQTLPTKAQREKLQAFCRRYDGEVIVDFDDAQGNTVHSVEYPSGTGPVRITNDIRRYFEEGILPEVSDVQRYRFSLRDPQNLVEMIETDPDVLNEQVQQLNEQVRAQTQDLQSYTRTVAALSSTVKHLRGELRLTHGKEADRTAARKKANALKKQWESGYDAAQLTEDLAAAWESLVEMTASGMDDADVGAALNAGVAQIAESILQGNTHRDTQVYEDAAELRAYLRGTTISFNEGQLGEIRSKYGSLQSYRNSLMGKVKLSQNSGNTIDSMWGELCDLFPGFFSPETPEGDQPARLHEVAQYIYNRPLANLGGMTDDEARNAIVLDVTAAVLDMTPRETFADKQRAKLDAAKQRIRALQQELADQAEEAHRAERQAARAAGREKRQALSERYTELKNEERSFEKEYRDSRKPLVDQLDKLKDEGKGKTAEAKGIQDKLESMRQKAKQRREAIASEMRKLREEYRQLSSEKIAMSVERRKVREEARLAIRNQRERMEERQRVERYRRNIQRTANELYNWVMRPTKDKHVPEALRNATIEFLQTLDFMSGQGPSRRSEAWREKLVNLSAAIRANGAEGNLFADADPNLLPNIEELLRRGKGAARVWQMSAADLEILDKIVATVKHQITTANELFQNELRQNAAELGEQAIAEMDRRKEARVYNKGTRASLQRFLKWNLIDANTAGHVMGSAVESVVQELRNGFDVRIDDIDQAKTFVEDIFAAYKKDAKKDIRREAEELHAFDIGGQKVELTTGEIMKLYTLSKRAQALPHLYEGGFRTTRSDNKGRRMTRPVRLNEESLKTITDALTDRQKQLADELQRFQSTTMADWGNEASLKRFGYRVFNEEFYSSISSDSNFLSSSGNEIDEGGNLNAGYYAIANLGMTKQTQPNANNPVTVPDIFTDFLNHVDKMSAYHAYLVPLADAMRVFNYKASDDSGRRSVRQSMDRAFGPQGWQYLSRLIKRLNGMDQRERGSGLMRNARVASVAANLSVIVQQPTAIVRAASILDGKYVSAAIATAIPTLRKYRNLAQQYAPIAKWKSWGFLDAGLGPSLRSVVMGDASVREKIQNAATAPAGAADDVSWGVIFHACVMQIKAGNKSANLTQEEIYREAGKLFSRVIDETQVVDSPFHRAPFLDNQVYNTLLPFRSEPLKSYSMFVRKWDDVRTGKERSKRRYARTATAWFLSNVLASACSTAVQTFIRGSGDEEDEEGNRLTGLERWLNNFLGDWSSWMPHSMIPVLSDAFDYAISGWGASRLDTKGIEGMVDVGAELIKAFNGESKKSPYGLFRDAAEAFSYLSGIPLYAAMRDIGEPVWKLVNPEGPVTQSVTSSSTDTYDALFAAYMEGDKAAVESLTATLLAGTPILSAKDQDTVNMELGKRLAETDDPALHAAVTARRRGDVVELKKQIEKFENMGFSRDVITRALNRMKDKQEEAVELLAGEETETESKPAALYEADDMFAAIRNNNLTGAREIYDYLVERSEAEDPKQAVKNTLTREFREEYVELYMGGDLEAARAISGPLLEMDVGFDADKDFRSWLRDEMAERMDAALGERDVGLAQVLIERQYDEAGREATGMKNSLTSKAKKRVTGYFEEEDFVGIEDTWTDLTQLKLRKSDEDKRLVQYYDDFDKVIDWVSGYVEDRVEELANAGDMAGMDDLARKFDGFLSFFGVDWSTNAYQYVDDLFQSYIDEQEAMVWLG